MLVLFATLAFAQEVFNPGNGVTLPSVVSQVRADYTEAAKNARIEGTVTMQAIVLADGSVGDVTVTTSLDSATGLDQEAVNALKKWTFRPGTKDGNPVAVRITVETTFSLK